MGLLDFLSPAITAGVQGASAYQGGAANAAEMQKQTLLDMAGLSRQHQQDDMARAEMNAKLMAQGVLPPGVQPTPARTPRAATAPGASDELPHSSAMSMGDVAKMDQDIYAKRMNPEQGAAPADDSTSPDDGSRYVDLGGGYRYDTGSLAEMKKQAEIGDIQSQGRYRDAQSKYYAARAGAQATPSSQEDLEEAYVRAGFPRDQAHLMSLSGGGGAARTTGDIARAKYPTTSISVGTRGSAATGRNGGPKPMTETQRQQILTTRASAIVRASAQANGGFPTVTYTDALQQAAASMAKDRADGASQTPTAPALPLPPGLQGGFPGTPNKTQDPVLSKYTGLTP